jgi:hypothetical protein
MLPIAESTLSFGEIADYWSREIYPPASWDEILRTLESAWWLGELRGNSGPTRLQRLKNMFTSMRQRDDLEIGFIVSPGPLPVDLQDRFKPRYQIRVRSDHTESWDEAACSDAFAALAKTCSKESYPELKVGFTLTKLSYEEFSTWCTKRGFSIPTFWKPRDQLVAPQKTWQVKPGKSLTTTEAAVVRVMNELFPDGKSDLVAKARDELVKNRLTHRAVSSRTIQRTLEKIHFV